MTLEAIMFRLSRVLLTLLVGLGILALRADRIDAARILPVNQHIVTVQADWSPSTGPGRAIGYGCDALELASSLRDDMVARGFGSGISASGNAQSAQIFYLHFGFPPYPSSLGVKSRFAPACGSASVSARVTELPGIGWVIDIVVN